MVYKGSLEDFKNELRNNNKNPRFISSIENLTEEMAIEAIRVRSYYFRYLPLQTPAICLEAVCRNGLLLEFVWKQTEEIVRDAVIQNKNALQFVKDEFKEIAMNALKGREPFIVKARTIQDALGNSHDVIGVLFYGTKGSGSIHYWGVWPINNTEMSPLELMKFQTTHHRLLHTSIEEIKRIKATPVAINFDTVEFLGRYDKFYEEGLEDNGLMYFPTTEEKIQQLNNENNKGSLRRR